MSATTFSPEASLNDARPHVAGTPRRWPIWLFGATMVALALGLFAGLEARRSTISSPRTTIGGSEALGTITDPPELAIPGEAFAANQTSFAYRVPSRLVATAVQPRTLSAPPAPQRGPRPPAPVNEGDPVPPYQPETRFQQPAVVYSATSAQPPAPLLAPSSTDPTLSSDRAQAGRLLNPGTTVPQGAMIQAVLETALDSTRPGFARAIVSQNVYSFDGSQVLIPRGSRIYGEYRADLTAGQNRAFILWQRLLRPDGVTITLGSPAADPLGRTGVRGRVNSHFFARFAGALLQSTLDIGVGLATRAVTDDTVILALPGSTQNVTSSTQADIRSTLTVRHGTSVSVFVARDLDFAVVED